MHVGVFNSCAAFGNVKKNLEKIPPHPPPFAWFCIKKTYKLLNSQVTESKRAARSWFSGVGAIIKELCPLKFN